MPLNFDLEGGSKTKQHKTKELIRAIPQIWKHKLPFATSDRYKIDLIAWLICCISTNYMCLIKLSQAYVKG